MAEKTIDLSIVAKGFQEFGTSMRKAADSMRKLGVALKLPEVPVEKVLYMEAYSGKRRWGWRKKTS